MMRRALVVMAVIACLAIALPAAAQKALSVRLTSPNDGARAEGTVNVHAEASSAAGVKSIAIFIDGLKVASREPSGIAQSSSVDYSWDTTISTGSSQIAPNGEYTVRVEARDGSGATDATQAVVLVDNGVSQVSGVSVTDDGKSATVSWSANPEPDVLSYRVERDSGEGFVTAGETQQTSFTESLQPGDYLYRVTAIRRSPTSPSGRVGSPSAAVAVRITAPPPPSSATGKNGGGGGSGAAVKGNTEKGFVTASGKRLGISGLPGGISLPGLTGLPSFPTGELPFDWGTFEKKLPYSFPRSAGDGDVLAADNVAAMSPWRIIPPDGLRWLAAGLFMVVTAGLLQFLAARTKA